VKRGRKQPLVVGPHLKLKNYLRGAALPAAPASCDYSPKAASVLSDIYGNDTLGDCVIAGGYHIVGAETGNAGDLFHASSAQIVADYSAIGGYVPGDPSTDQGCDLQTALNYWTSHGFANGTKLIAWLGVDPTNVAEMQLALWLFGNLYFGMGLPDAWVQNEPSASGFTWDVAGAYDPNNGHCVMGVGYGSKGIEIDTWGMLGTLTYAACAEYAASKDGGELYVMLTPDQLTKGQSIAPNGVAWTDLLTDWNAIGGHVVVPPAPAPSPTPTPPGSAVTLAQAQQWAQQGIAQEGFLMTRGQAQAAASAALAANWPAAS
jgi:hypothetical protein